MRLFLMLCWLTPKATIAQPAASTPVYQAYLRDAVFAVDPLAPRPVDYVVLMPLDSGLQRLKIDTAYLRDYLAGRLESNPVFRELVQPTGGTPLSWLSHPWGLEPLLQRDHEAGALLLRLDSALQGPHRLPALEPAGDRVRPDAGARYGFKHGWGSRNSRNQKQR